MSREIARRHSDVSGPLSPDPRRATLIVAITCASISLVAAFLTFWWLATMKRSFRHRLIMLLIVSDMCKAVWFLVFPLVALVSGPVSSSSSFCQASGFFLAQATEASDFAALLLALQLVTCVFRPPKRGYQGGLYSFRRWIYLLWAFLPILAASLAFANDSSAYVSYGAFCYLPEQPVWYRMALAWIPRYIVFLTIFSVAFTITIHVHIKFKHFSHLEDEGLAGQLRSEGSATTPRVPYSPSSPLPLENQSLSNSNLQSPTLTIWKDPFHPRNLKNKQTAFNDGSKIAEADVPTSNPGVPHRGTGVRDFAPNPVSFQCDHPIYLNGPPQPVPEPSIHIPRTVSETPSFATDLTDDVGGNCFRAPSAGTDSATEELLSHRHSIERHLRILFLYPISYLLVWIFPLVSQCLQLTGHHFENQALWLQILVTGVLALQASVDAAVFSYRERPWRRASGRALIPMDKLQRLKRWRPATQDIEKGGGAGKGTNQETTGQNPGSVSARGSVCWWEEEGRKRKDSVWMGTDAMSVIRNQQQQDEEADEQAIEEDKDPPSPDVG